MEMGEGTAKNVGEAMMRVLQTVAEAWFKDKPLILDPDKTELTFVADYLDKND